MTETAAFGIIPTDLWEPEIKTVVGEIAIAFAQLEHTLWVLPKRIKRLTLREWVELADVVSIPTRCAQIRAEFAKRHMHQQQEAELDELLKAVERVNEDRNAVIHGQWGCKKDRPGGAVVSVHRVWKQKDRGADLEQLQNLRDEIRNLRDRLGRFVWPDGSKRKPRPDRAERGKS